jgi:tRNA(Ile)-lysidine synthase
VSREARPRLLRALAAALDGPAGPARGEHLLVAVSGGPDSTALLAALAEVAPARDLRLTAACIDHALRGAESAAESAGVVQLGARLGVPVITRRVPVATGSGLEARARRTRYRTLASIAAEVGATRIVTAHTADDQTETLLLRLVRGAGRGGLGGMRPARGRILRPLLGATRADVRRFLAERGLGFALDRTNADLRHARNRMRRLVVPLLREEFNPRLVTAVAALAGRLRDEDDVLAATAAARLSALVAGGALSVAVAGEPPALGRRIVRTWLAGGGARGVDARHVERVLALASGAGRGAVAIPGPARVLREGDRLVRRAGREPGACAFRLAVAPGAAAAHPDGGWRLTLTAPRPRRAGELRPPDPTHALFDAGALPAGLCVRSPRPGDRVALLGGPTRKLQDVLVDAKVPREARPRVAVLVADDEEILWVAGLARGRGAALTPSTSVVVEGVLERTG